MHALVPSFITERLAAGELTGRFPAATLHLDMSGFTATTEALMRHGKNGAEVLAEVLSGILGTLVDTVYEQDGFVAAFGGDGFTAVFPERATADSAPTEQTGPAAALLSARRALAAAQAIRQRVLKNADFATDFGVFSFAAKVSLATESVDWHIWLGDEPADQSAAFAFSGPGIDECTEGEEWAESGDILLGQSLYRRLAADRTAPIKARRLAPTSGPWRVEQIPGGLPPPQKPKPIVPAPGPFYSPSLVARQSSGEFRYVVSVFLHLRTMPAGTTMRRLLRLLSRFGGYLCRLDHGGIPGAGPRLLLFWGAPTSFESDLERALGFLLEARQMGGSELRAGVTYHMAFAGFVGSALRDEYTCYGSRVNLAARIMRKADWGDIWLDRSIARRAEDRFDLRYVDDLEIKGFADPQPVFSLLARRSIRTEPFFQGHMVGREREFQLLQDAVRPIVEGRFAGVVTIVGEAGIGKSRLVHEFFEQSEILEQAELFLCQADQIVRESLNPFRYFLRQYFDQQDDLDDAGNKERFEAILQAILDDVADDHLRAELRRTRSFLGALADLRWEDSLYEQLGPQLRYENSQLGLKALIIAESTRRPVVIHVEDAHWLDNDSRDFLNMLTRDVGDYPFCIVVTRRPAIVSGQAQSLSFAVDVPQTRLELEPLSASEIAPLAASRLGGAVSPELSALLDGRAEGNPFFAEQLLLYLQENELLIVGLQGWQLREEVQHDDELPADVRAILVARLDRLVQSVKDVVQTAAVLGREFSVQVLSRMLHERPDVITSVRTAEEAAIWSALSELRYIFKHALLRDAAYEMQLNARLEELHLLAAETMIGLYGADPAPYYADIAYHYRRAGDRKGEARYARLAGESAASRFANAEAVDQLSRALELTRDAEKKEQFELLRTRIEVYGTLGDNDARARDLLLLTSLAEQIKDSPEEEAERQAEVSLDKTKLYEATGDFPAAVEAAADTVRWARSARLAEVEAAGRVRWAVALWRQGHYEAAKEQAQKTLSLTRSAGLAQLEGHALVQMGNVAWFMGEYATAAIHYEEALPIYRELADPRGEAACLMNIGLVQLNQGEVAKAIALFKESLAIYVQIGSRTNVARAYTALGGAYQRLGQFDAAISQFQASLPVARDTGDRNGESLTLIALADLYRDLGRYERAAGYYASCYEIAHQLGNRRTQATARIRAGLMAHMRGDQDMALAHLREATELSKPLGLKNVDALLQMALGHTLAARSQFADAEAAYRVAVAIRRDLDELHLATEILAGLASISLELGELAGAKSYVEEILAIRDKRTLDGTEEPLRIYFTCFRVLQASGDRRAAKLLQAGHALMQQWANAIADEKLKASFLENVAVNRAIAREAAALALE